jgi:hypothetical protein
MGVRTGGRYYRLVHNRPGQQPALEIWQGEEALVLAAQQASQVQAGCVTTSIPQFTKPAA